jgi:hypothetical protein
VRGFSTSQRRAEEEKWGAKMVEVSASGVRPVRDLPKWGSASTTELSLGEERLRRIRDLPRWGSVSASGAAADVSAC